MKFFRKSKSLLFFSTSLTFLALTQFESFAASPSNLWGSNETTPAAAVDHSKPVSRGYLIPSTTAISDGVKLSVEIYQDRLNSPVALTLQAAINDGSGNVRIVDLLPLDKPSSVVVDMYYEKREFVLKTAELNKLLSPYIAKSPGLVVGPGTALFVWGLFSGGHNWGSIGRGGIFFIPENGTTTSASTLQSTAKTRRPSELDIAYPIIQTMANPYNNPVTQSGLKVGGQIRSRVESEGKFQVVIEDMERIKKEFFALAADPAKVHALLGPEWSVTALLKYMKKDSSGNMLLDANGLPTPDPMVDTYYDNKNFDAAKHDMAIRYRWTEGNATGAWNFKPGMAAASSAGIVDRVEYGIDTTDDKPETIAKFADSLNPINPFRHIRAVIPNSKPSDFLNPSVKITDTRFKFELKNSSGLIIEVSLDDVDVLSLRKDRPGSSKYAQVEMDIDHLSTKSQNSIKANNSNYGSGMAVSNIPHFYGNEAFFDGRPVLHGPEDLLPDSAVKIAHQSDFNTAAKAITAIRDGVIGKNWLPGGQKYAFGAATLGLIKEKEASPSVRKLLEADKAFRSTSGAQSKTLFSTSIALCGEAFN